MVEIGIDRGGKKIGHAQEFFFAVAFKEIDRFCRRPASAVSKPLAPAGEVGAPRRVRDLETARTLPPSGIKDSAALSSYHGETVSLTSSNRRATSPSVIPSEPVSSSLSSRQSQAKRTEPVLSEAEGRDQRPSVIPSEPSGSEATRDQREAIFLSPPPPPRAVELRRIDVLDPLTGAATEVYNAAENLVRPIRKQPTLADCAALPPPSANRLTLHFLTQTRLKHEGGYTRIPEFQIVFRRLLGRLSSLSRFHCGAPLDVDFKGLIDKAGHVRLVDNQTRWVSWTRYSNRQRQRMDWEGIIGSATHEFVPRTSASVIPTEPSEAGDEGSTRSDLIGMHAASVATKQDQAGPQAQLASFCKFLKFGEFVHVGHGATFGLGRYAIQR